MKAKIFYCNEMTATKNDSFSPSAGKPSVFVNDVKEGGYPVEIIKPHIVADTDDFCMAHSTEFVNGILLGTRSNGFGNTYKEVTETLKYTTGALMSAASYALENNEITCAPVSGFHHAGHAFCGGFCTFNGLIVTAQFLQKNYKSKVAILDLDQHYGNGTVDIINKLNLDHYINHYTFGGEKITTKNSEEWLEELDEIVRELIKDVDIVLYQAGADPHINDPLGGVLTTNQMRRRDDIVFNAARSLGKPVAWVLAGGYQTPLSKVIDLHINTLVCSLGATPLISRADMVVERLNTAEFITAKGDAHSLEIRTKFTKIPIILNTPDIVRIENLYDEDSERGTFIGFALELKDGLYLEVTRSDYLFDIYQEGIYKVEDAPTFTTLKETIHNIHEFVAELFDQPNLDYIWNRYQLLLHVCHSAHLVGIDLFSSLKLLEEQMAKMGMMSTDEKKLN